MHDSRAVTDWRLDNLDGSHLQVQSELLLVILNNGPTQDSLRGRLSPSPFPF